MIELTPLARPYAKALFASAHESNKLDQIAKELKAMAAASKTKEVINTIDNPSLSRQEVLEILTNLFKETVSSAPLKLIEILADNKRLNLIEPIYFIYQDLLEKHNDQNSIEVFVAVDPGPDAKENIERKLRSTYGEDAKINFSKDPKIMGGLSIKMGDETLDLSIKGKVNKLVNQLNF